MKNKVMKKRYRNILKRESQETVNQRLESLEQNNKSSLNACLAPSWYWNVSCSLCSVFNNPIQRQSLSISWPASYSLPHYHVLFSLNYYYQKLSSLFFFLSFLFVYFCFWRLFYKVVAPIYIPPQGIHFCESAFSPTLAMINFWKFSQSNGYKIISS